MFSRLVLAALVVSCGDDRPIALDIDAAVLPAGRVGEPYAAKFSASGGVPPYAWTLANGELPRGMALEGDTVDGRPEEAGRFAIVVAVSDFEGARALAAFALRIEDQEPPLVLGPPTCEQPHPIDLSSDSAVIAGNFEGLRDDTAVACAASPGVEAVFRIVLDAPADLSISPGELTPNIAFDLREDGCAGRVLACSDYGSRYVPALAAGTYDLIIEPRSLEAVRFSVTVERLPPTPRPANDTCATAEPVMFVDDVAAIDVDLSAASPGTAFGSCTPERALYYALSFARPSLLMLHSSSTDLTVEVAKGTCQAATSFGCATYSDLCPDEVLVPGTYLIAVSGGDQASGMLTLERRDAPPPPSNDTCAAATQLTMANGRAEVSGSIADANDDVELFSQSCDASDFFPDVFYAIELPQVSDVAVELTSSSEFQVGLLSGGCLAGVPACSDLRAAVHYNVPAGALALAVEHVRRPFQDECEAPGFDDFALTVSVTPSPPAPANDLCTDSEPIVLGAVGSSVSLLGTTHGANGEVDSLECPQSYFETLAPDVFYRLDLGAAGRLRITSTTAEPLLLSLHGTACGATGALACGDYFDNPTLETLSPLPPATYYLRVDHDSNRTPVTPGDFLLTAELLP